MNKDATLQTYLIVNDEDEAIQPSFYSFGSGNYEVQVNSPFASPKNCKTRLKLKLALKL